MLWFKDRTTKTKSKLIELERDREPSSTTWEGVSLALDTIDCMDGERVISYARLIVMCSLTLKLMIQVNKHW